MKQNKDKQIINTKSEDSPFNWKNKPSTFINDPNFQKPNGVRPTNIETNVLGIIKVKNAKELYER